MYKITKEVTSAAFFPTPTAIAGFTFHSPGTRGSSPVHVSGDWDAADFQTALSQWEARLKLVVDAIAASKSLATSTYGGSVLVEKTGTEVASFLHFVTEPDVITVTDVLPGQLDGIAETLGRIDANQRLADAALNYRESVLYGSTLVAAIHLLRSLEVLAGKSAHTPKCSACGHEIACRECGRLASWPRTDHAALESMLGTPAYRYFYRAPSVRNRIMHGSFVEQTELATHMGILRAAVQDKLWDELGLPANPTYGRQRGPLRYRASRIWIHKEGAPVTLAQLLHMRAVNTLSFHSVPRALANNEIESLGGAF